MQFLVQGLTYMGKWLTETFIEAHEMDGTEWNVYIHRRTMSHSYCWKGDQKMLLQNIRYKRYKCDLMA